MEGELSKRKGVESTKRHVTARPHAQQDLNPKPTTSLPRPYSQTHTKKRKLTNTNMNLHQHHSPYFKIRALVQQLRPHFIEVLGTPDFRNSKAADEIRKQMKLLMELQRQMAKDTGTERKFVPEHQHDSNPAKESKDGKPAPLQQLQPSCSIEKSVHGSTQSVPLTSSDMKPVDIQPQGSYIVGGSAFGWNFIIFSAGSCKPVYYGVTKEAYRRRNNRSGEAHLPVTSGFSDKRTPGESGTSTNSMQ